MGVKNTFSDLDKAELSAGNKLSFAQQGIWFSDQMAWNNAQLNIAITMELKGVVDIPALQKAINAIVFRHEILRTVYGVIDGELTRHIKHEYELPINIIDFNNAFPAEREALLEAAIKDELKQPFDLGRDSPIRVTLIPFAMHYHMLVFTAHSIVWDMESRNVIVNEIAWHYRRFLEDMTVAIAPLPSQYADYALKQRTAYNNGDLRDQAEYWSQQLNGISPVHNLVPDNPRPAHMDYAAQLFEQSLSAPRTSALRKLGRDNDTSLFAVLYSAFALLLGRWSYDDDIVIGSQVSDRNESNASLIGCFSNSLVYRTSLRDNVHFTDLLDRTTNTIEKAHKNSALPFEALVNILHPERGLSYHPVFQIMFNLRRWRDVSVYLPGLNLKLIDRPSSIVRYDIELDAVDQGDHIQFSWIYNASLFESDTIRRIAESFDVLLNGVADNPATRIYNLPLSTHTDYQLLNQWNNKCMDEVEHSSVLETIETHAERIPDAVALQIDMQYLTYGQLDRRANRLGNYLLKKGAIPGDVVGLCCEPSIELVVGILAIFKIRGIYTPLDPNFPVSRLQKILSEAKPVCILTSKKSVKALPVDGDKMVCLDSSDFANQLALFSSDKPDIGDDIKGQQPAYLIYTSGSSGSPKGVIGLQQSLVNRICWMNSEYPHSADEILCMKTSIGFVDHLAEVFQPLSSGNRLIIVPEEVRADIPAFCHLIQRMRISRVTLVPSFLNAILNSDHVAALKTLRYIICSGEALSMSTVKKCRTLLRDTRLINLFGATETGADVTFYEVDDYRYLDVMQYFPVKPSVRFFTDTELDFKAGRQTAKSLTELKALFDETVIPDRPRSLEGYLDEFRERVLSGIVDVSSETYIGHMTSALPNFLPEFSKLISQLNQNVVKVETSKSVTFLERQVLSTMHRLFFRLPEEFYKAGSQDPTHVFGVMTSGGSIANLTALWCARNRALLEKGFSRNDLKKHGVAGVEKQLGLAGGVIIGSRLMHYSMRKIASLFGIGENNIRYIPQQGNLKVSMADLRECIDQAHRNGEYIIALVGIAGATETGTIDPLNNMADIATEHNIHFHVDAAWGGAFQFSDLYRHKLHGIHRADSITICPHKQLYLPQGMSLCLFRDTGSARDIAVHASYQAAEGSYDLGQYSIEGSRPANAIFLHASLHLLAKAGYSWLVEQSMEKTRYFVKMLEFFTCFELIGEPEINIINYRYIPTGLRENRGNGFSREENKIIDDAVKRIQEIQFAQGKTFVSKTRISDSRYSDEPIWVFRVVLSNPLTRKESLCEVLREQVAIAAESVDAAAADPAGQLQAELFDREDKEKFDHRVIPIGRPIKNTAIFIVDQNLSILPVGAVGELCVGGKGLAVGYLNNPRETLARFISLPDGNTSVYRTGDLARWRPDGNIEFLGRMDGQINLRGFRIEPAETESVLLGQAGVNDAVVLPQIRKDGEKFLVAYIKTDRKEPAMEAELKEALTAILPAYMVPFKYVFCERFPLTPTGKVDRRAFKPVYSNRKKNIRQQTPGTEKEKILARVWSELFDIPVSSISVDDNFFSLGGDSLLVGQAVSLARKHKLKHSIKQLFQRQTIRGLAKVSELLRELPLHLMPLFFAV